MPLNDAGLSADMDAALVNIHSRPDAQSAFAGAITGYAAGAQLQVPGDGLVAPTGPVTGVSIAAVTFVEAALTAGLSALWGADHSRAEARDLMTAAIQAYAATATATVASAGLTSPAGPLIGAAATLPATFDDGGLADAMAAIWAQDNSAEFAAAALAAAVRNYFKSGRLPVPGTPGFTAPAPPSPAGPVSGQATGAII